MGHFIAFSKGMLLHSLIHLQIDDDFNLLSAGRYVCTSYIVWRASHPCMIDQHPTSGVSESQ